ncbi:GAF and ANTAR domain-containing protein [Actinokineospora sp. HBU206404]|uniref:GAF and ANTAR domain-containing protein n=1 Tax=Actinokineospora xionganensis TaxID=2684470 RepID=A0ABR7KZW0_9PSEU|nr:GAF and ANTAR domain-containing protein [Actinokineospora xionganensis]
MWAEDKAQFVSLADKPADAVLDAELGPLSREFARLANTLLSAPTVAEVLEQVVWAARRVIPGADLVSVTLRGPDGSFHTPVETDPVAAKLDQLQYDTGEGPCVTAASASAPGYVRSDDLAREPQWPTFGPAAAACGYSAMLAGALVPDCLPPRLSGALNIYAREPGTLDAQAQETALLLAIHASLALATTKAVTQAELREAHLRRAIESRDVIGQAKGILMHRRGIRADEAFDLLRRTSQELNIKLADLARTLADRHGELDESAG